MKNQTISGNYAASNDHHFFIAPSHRNVEPWVTMRDVMRHFGMSRTTVWRSIYDHQMPCHRLRTHRLRFVISEIQEWLERTGRARFAAIGRASTLAALQQAVAADPVFSTLKIQISMPSPQSASPPFLSKNILKQSDRS